LVRKCVTVGKIIATTATIHTISGRVVDNPIFHISPMRRVKMEIKRAAQKNKFVQLLFIEMLITYALKADKGNFSLLYCRSFVFTV
jgi:hypothetical protein